MPTLGCTATPTFSRLGSETIATLPPSLSICGFGKLSTSWLLDWIAWGSWLELLGASCGDTCCSIVVLWGTTLFEFNSLGIIFGVSFKLEITPSEVLFCVSGTCGVKESLVVNVLTGIFWTTGSTFGVIGLLSIDDDSVTTDSGLVFSIGKVHVGVNTSVWPFNVLVAKFSS